MISCYGLAFSRLGFLRSWIIACMVFMVLDAAFDAYIKFTSIFTGGLSMTLV